MERLLNILKPGKDYDGNPRSPLDLETIESNDRTRQGYNSQRKFDIQLDRLEDAITYIEKSFFYFLFLILWRTAKLSTNEAGRIHHRACVSGTDPRESMKLRTNVLGID